MHPTLVIQPTSSFQQIDEALTRLGWVRAADTSAAPPLVTGEPEFASWSERGDDGRISYTFNPVVKLRVFVFYGPRAGEQLTEVERALPTLGLRELRELLQSTEVRQLLLGVFAARELKAFTVLDLLEPLHNHQEATIARAARKAHEELLQFAIEISAERLREEKKRHPERSALFPHLGDAQVRRQTLRWLIRDRSEVNEHITAVFRSGLADEDWEVRATAMLAAVRLRAKELGGEIRRMDLPRTSRNGPDETDRTILFAARKIALEYPAQDTAELQMPVNRAAMDEDQRKSKEAILQHLRRCMVGLPVTQCDRVFLLINALTEPLEVEGLPPPDSSAIVAHEGTFRLKRSGIELCWIPPVAHWLGTDEKDLPIHNPIRQVTLDRGFFVARYPLSVSLAQQIYSSAQPQDHGDGTDSQKPYLCDWGEAVRLCERLSELESVKVCLPTADQWEIAARGTDGRRYPWGNGFEGDPSNLASPWGVEKQVAGVGEWTSTAIETREPIICGGKRDLRCAARYSVAADNPDTRYAVRPVVLLSKT